MSALAQDPLSVETTPRLRALIDYAFKLTKTPGRMRRADVESLQEVGYSDQGVAGINQIVGFFNWVNRSVSGLGATLEAHWPQDVRDADEHPPD